MSDDTEEKRRPSLFDWIRKIPFLIGVLVMLWIVLAKNIPAINAPHNPTPPQAKEQARQAPVVQAAVAPVAPLAPTVTADADKEHITHLEEQIARLSSELTELKTQINAKKDDEKLAHQEQRIQAMKTQIDALQENGSEHLAIITAFSVMKEAALHGEPFDSELKEIGKLLHSADKKALLTPLEPFAEKGISTPAELQSQFDEALPNALSPNHKTDSFLSNLKSLIRIRKEGEQQQGTDDEAVLARAEAKVHRGEIAGGLKELQTLSPAAADAMAGWMKNAKNSLDGRSALDALQLAILKDKEKLQGADESQSSPQNGI